MALALLAALLLACGVGRVLVLCQLGDQAHVEFAHAGDACGHSHHGNPHVGQAEGGHPHDRHRGCAHGQLGAEGVPTGAAQAPLTPHESPPAAPAPGPHGPDESRPQGCTDRPLLAEFESLPDQDHDPVAAQPAVAIVPSWTTAIPVPTPRYAAPAPEPPRIRRSVELRRVDQLLL